MRVKVYLCKPPDRPNLQLRWKDPDTGKPCFRSTRTADEAESERQRADLEYELNNGGHTPASRLTWAAFREMFESEYVSGLRPRTREKYHTVFTKFELLIRPTKLAAINERTLSLFVKGMRERKQGGRRKKIGMAAFSIRNYVVGMKKALNWALKQKLIPKAINFDNVRVPKKKPQPIPAEAFERLLAQAPDDMWAAYLLCGWRGGLRLSEALELRWERNDEKPWLDFAANRIILPAVFVKGTEDQGVPIHQALKAALDKVTRTCELVFPFKTSRRRGGRLSRSGVYARIETMAHKAGVKLNMQKLRKGFGCQAAKILGKSGAPILHELMRHKSMQVTMDFYANVDDALQDAINSME